MAALLFVSSATARTDTDHPVKRTPYTKDGQTLKHHKKRAKALIRKGYDTNRWRDKTPWKAAEKRNWQRHRTAILHKPTRSQISKYRDKRAKAFRAHRDYQLTVGRYTPYSCGSAGNWAIPCAIVACESGYSWSAYNPSGAIGPYQLLGKGAVWPVRTDADKLEHHRIAYNLYAGGAGRSHWVC